MDAAQHLDVEVQLAVTVASEETSPLTGNRDAAFLTLDFRDADRAAADAIAFAQHHPIGGVVGVDDQTTVAATVVAEALGLPHNAPDAARAAQDKHRMRERLRAGGVRVPDSTLIPLDADVAAVAGDVPYPCVLKPRGLAASQGVIRANHPQEFIAAFARVARIIRHERERTGAGLDAHILVDAYVPGREVAFEGLLAGGELLSLALFDKPDPLEGPYFEETIYVTPSRLGSELQREITTVVVAAAAALGLREGPVHAELRLGPDGPSVLEVAARSIGGLCSRTLRFGVGVSLEELIIRHAMGLEIESYERERQPAGVMMIPIPHGGRFREVRGVDAACAVAGIEDVQITAHPGQTLTPLPEGSLYLGFIFARAHTPDAVETALRAAHAALEFVIA